MNSQKRSKSSQQRRPKPRTARTDAGLRPSVPLSEAHEGLPSPLTNLLSFAGYMLSVWLIGQTISLLRAEPPAFGLVWSPALLGIVVALSTAVVKDELDIRARLGIEDFSSRKATLVWGGLGAVAILAIMTFPQIMR